MNLILTNLFLPLFPQIVSYYVTLACPELTVFCHVMSSS